MRVYPYKSSFVGALHGLLARRGDPCVPKDLFGRTGFAFRLTVSPTIGLDGPSAFPWAEELPAAVARLGYRSAVVSAAPSSHLWNVERSAALRLVEQNGPAIAWGIQVPEFGLVARSQSAATNKLAISGVLDSRAGSREMTIEQLGEGDAPGLFVMALLDFHAPDPEQALVEALTEALRLGHRGFAPEGYATGLAAYRAWLAALASGHIDPAGHAYVAMLAAEARHHAAAFLEQAAEGLSPEGHSKDEPLAQALAGAAAHYGRSHAALSELSSRCPFPPTAPLDNHSLEASRALVERAATAEGEGLAAIEAALSHHAAGQSRRKYQIADARPQDLFFCLGDLPIGGLDPYAEACRERIAPVLGRDFFAKVAIERATGRVMGHVYYAPLAKSQYPIVAEGSGANLWFLFCPWVHTSVRGRGIGKLLWAALKAHGRECGVGGIVTEASNLPIFLPPTAFLAAGFRELATAGEMHLCYLPLTDEHPVVHYVSPPSATQDAPAGKDGGTIVVRHAYNCPLLLATRCAAAEGGRQAGFIVDEADATGPEAGVVVRGKRLANLPASPDVLLESIRKVASETRR